MLIPNAVLPGPKTLAVIRPVLPSHKAARALSDPLLPRPKAVARVYSCAAKSQGKSDPVLPRPKAVARVW